MTKKDKNEIVDQIVTRLEGYIDVTIEQKLDKFVTREEFDLRFDQAFGKLDQILQLCLKHDAELILMNHKLSEHDDQFVQIDKRFEDIDKRFISIEHKLSEHDDRFERIEKKQDDMSHDIHEIKNNLIPINNKITQHDEQLKFYDHKFLIHDRELEELKGKS